VENIGIILLGLGMAMVFIGFGHRAAGTLGLIAGLYHTLNHAVLRASYSSAPVRSCTRRACATSTTWAA